MNTVLFSLDCKCWNWLCWTRTPLSGCRLALDCWTWMCCTKISLSGCWFSFMVNGGTNGFHWRRLVVSKSHLAFSPRCKRISDSHWALASTFPWLILRIFFLQDCPATLKNGKYYVSYALFTLTTTKVAKVVYKYFIAFNTHLPIKIFSPYFVDFLVLIWVALSTILFISSAGKKNLLKSLYFLYRRRRENFFSRLQNFSTRNSPSVFPYLVKRIDNGSYPGLREPIRKLENHYPELKIY